jgi:LysR family nitrogen assimilation transcriptional regulator
MTEAGAYLARCGADILSRIDEAVVTVRNMSDVAQGPVSLGVPPGLSLALSIPLLETIFVERPEIRMSIMEGVSDDVLRWIEDETVDMGCVYDAVETSVYAVEPLMTEEVFLVTALDNWDGEIGPNGVAVDPITPEQLAQLPLVMTGARGGRAIQEIVSRATGSRLNVLATINSLAQIVEMVSRASAYAILSHASIYQQVQDKQLAIVRIEGTPLFHTAYIVRKRSRAVSQNTMILEAYLRSIMSEMVERHDIIGIKVLDSGKTSGQPKQISR